MEAPVEPIYRYIVTQDHPGKHYIITVAIGDLRFTTVRYNLHRVYFDFPKLVWKLDKRSIRYVPNAKVIENSVETPKWKHS